MTMKASGSNPSAKRRKNNDTDNDGLAQCLLQNHNLEQDDFWETARLFTVLEDQRDPGGITAKGSSKRKRDDLDRGK